jgi:hypothetical protein
MDENMFLDEEDEEEEEEIELAGGKISQNLK